MWALRGVDCSVERPGKGLLNQEFGCAKSCLGSCLGEDEELFIDQSEV